ncbi:MAG: cadherin-like domain-containing protein, partial [Candidatus Marinimicrobia bacterium]|nr:cadherin-like domain-containing protein [Candidatus Neomarinimicrobiota bacterium]
RDLGNTGIGDELQTESTIQVQIDAINDPPVNETISGYESPPLIIVEGVLLTATSGHWNDNLDTDISSSPSNITYEYEWQRASDENGSELDSLFTAYVPEYTLTDIDSQKYLRIKITATDDGVGQPSQESTIAYSEYYYVDNSAPYTTNIEIESKNLDEDGILIVDGYEEGLLYNYIDAEEDSLIAVIAVDATHGTLILDSLDGTYNYTPYPNYNGSDYFEFKVFDGLLFSTENGIVNLNIAPLNDRPSFTPGGDITVNEGSGIYASDSNSPWATNIIDGESYTEDAQTLKFILYDYNSELFADSLKINSETGALSFTINETVGSTLVTVILEDDGLDNDEGNFNSSVPIIFSINIEDINQSPSFDAGEKITVIEDYGEYSQSQLSVTPWATNIVDGESDTEDAQTLEFIIISNSDTTLFSIQPVINDDGNLSFTTAENKNGLAEIKVVLEDGGEEEYPHFNTSAEKTLIIELIAVNDEPVWLKGSDIEVIEDFEGTGIYASDPNFPWATEIDDGDPDTTQILTFNFIHASDSSLFSSFPSIDGNGRLTFTLEANKNGSSSIEFNLSDTGGTENNGVDSTIVNQSFEIIVTPVNDPPRFVFGTLNQEIVIVEENEDEYTQIGIEVTEIDATIDGFQPVTYAFGESIYLNPSSNQFEAIDESSGNTFAILNIDENEGEITITRIPDGNGSAIITVTAHDNSGVENGGVEEFERSFTFIVNALNDPPAFKIVDPWGNTIGNEEIIEFYEDFPNSLISGTAGNYNMDLSMAPDDEIDEEITFSC